MFVISALILQLSQVHKMFTPVLWHVLKLITLTPMVLLYSSSAIPVTAMAARNALLGPNTRLKYMLLSLHSTSYQTFLVDPSDSNCFCLCSISWRWASTELEWFFVLHYWHFNTCKVTSFESDYISSPYRYNRVERAHCPLIEMSVNRAPIILEHVSQILTKWLRRCET
jgi:hypothetical protein